jgi:hypothetical protein
MEGLLRPGRIENDTWQATFNGKSNPSMAGLKRRADAAAKTKAKKGGYGVNLVSIQATLTAKDIAQKNQSASILTDNNILMKLKERLEPRWKQSSLGVDFEVYYLKYEGGIEPPEVVTARKVAEALEVSNSSQATTSNKKKKSNTGGGTTIMQLIQEADTRDSMQSQFDGRVAKLLEPYKCTIPQFQGHEQALLHTSRA